MLRRTFLALGWNVFLLAASKSSAKATPAAPTPPAKAEATVQVMISGIAFAEITEPLAVGDTIEWINKDVVAHTATARNKDWRVVVGANERARLVLKKAGTVDYYCEYHPNMTGRIVVKESRA